MSETDNVIWRRLTALKQTNPGLQVWLSIGGSMMTDFGQPTEHTFEQLVHPEAELQTAKRQGQFAKSLLSVMEEYGFDGVDFDW